MAPPEARTGAASGAGRALLTLSALTAALWAVFAAPAWAENYKVTNTGDTGGGTLRRAIELANAHGGYDAVVFQLEGGGPHTIAPTSPLPPPMG
jgi:hypothetical protein